MSASAIAVQPAKRTGFHWGRLLRILAVVLAVILVVGYVGISAYTADRLTRPTRAAITETPAQYGLKYEDVQFTTAGDNIALRGWLIDSPGNKVIVMLHGRNGTRAADQGLEKASLLAGHGYDVLMFDFRAHGQSDGERYSLGPWETRDVTGALNYLKGRGYTTFGTYGVSMGAGTSLLAAPDHPEIKALLVDSPYADLPSLVDQQLSDASGLPAFFNPGIFFMTRTLYGLDFASAKPAEVLPKLGDRPIFQIHSRDEDLRIPLEQAYAIQRAGAGDPNFTSWLAPGKGHVKAFVNNKAEYTQRMLAFYDKYLQ